MQDSRQPGRKLREYIFNPYTKSRENELEFEQDHEIPKLLPVIKATPFKISRTSPNAQSRVRIPEPMGSLLILTTAVNNRSKNPVSSSVTQGVHCGYLQDMVDSKATVTTQNPSPIWMQTHKICIPLLHTQLIDSLTGPRNLSPAIVYYLYKFAKGLYES